MLNLAINTASSFTAISLLEIDDSGNCHALRDMLWQSANDEAEKLMPAINDLLKMEKVAFEDVERVVVVKGPGSFTGLRVGITVANTYAYLNNCKLNAINTFDYWWKAMERYMGPKLDNSYALLVYAGSGGVYVSHFREDRFEMHSEKSGELVDLADLNKYLEEHKIKNIFGDITEDQKSEVTVAEFIEVNMNFGKVMEAFDFAKLEDYKIVRPLYVKDPAITNSKKSLLN